MSRRNWASEQLRAPESGSLIFFHYIGNTRTMIFQIPEIISYLSRFMSLQAGDIISTGTPPGVGLGQKPPLYLKAGQVMRLGIEGLGEQRQKTVQA